MDERILENVLLIGKWEKTSPLKWNLKNQGGVVPKRIVRNVPILLLSMAKVVVKNSKTKIWNSESNSGCIPAISDLLFLYSLSISEFLKINHSI